MLISLLSRNVATQIEEITPTKVHTTTIYESRRKLGQPLSEINEQHVEEKYEVTISSNYDESGLKILSPKPMTHTEGEE
jgi:hypothetical protein